MPSNSKIINLCRKLFKALSWYPWYNPEIECSQERVYKPDLTNPNSEAKEQLTLWARNSDRLCDILDCPYEIHSEPGHSGKMAHMGWLIAYKDIFVLDPDGEGTSPSGRNCLTDDQIKDMWGEYEALPEHLKARKTYVKKEEELFNKVLISEGLVYLDGRATGSELPREAGQYKREHIISFKSLGNFNDLVNLSNEWRAKNKDKKCARIDFLIRVEGGYVLLEVDEHQHNATCYAVDGPGGIERIKKIMEAMRRDGIRLPILVIRYNPHQYTIDGVPKDPPKGQRMDKLLDDIKSMDLTDKPSFQIEYRYYDAITDANGKEVAKVTQGADYQHYYQMILSLENIGSTPDSKKRKRQDAETPEPRNLAFYLAAEGRWGSADAHVPAAATGD